MRLNLNPVTSFILSILFILSKNQRFDPRIRIVANVGSLRRLRPFCG